jgi:hypothetical protein
VFGKWGTMESVGHKLRQTELRRTVAMMTKTQDELRDITSRNEKDCVSDVKYLMN